LLNHKITSTGPIEIIVNDYNKINTTKKMLFGLALLTIPKMVL